MLFKIDSDLGTLCVEFDGLRIWLCDNPSNECFERFEQCCKSVYGDGFRIDFLVIDSGKCEVSVYRPLEEGFRFLTVSYHSFFRYSPDCSLMKFVNMFSRKKLEYRDGNPRMVANRYFVRS